MDVPGEEGLVLPETAQWNDEPSEGNANKQVLHFKSLRGRHLSALTYRFKRGRAVCKNNATFLMRPYDGEIQFLWIYSFKINTHILNIHTSVAFRCLKAFFGGCI